MEKPFMTHKMSHIQSKHNGAEGASNTYLVILKVHGDSIRLWSREQMALVGKSRLFKIACHNVGTRQEDSASDIQVFLLNDLASVLDKCSFQDQHSDGQVIEPGDLAIFMTGPMPSSRKASYAIDLALGRLDEPNQQLAGSIEIDDTERIGRAYLYLDPEFSSQGIQTKPILAHQTHVPIGQIQVQYLIVTNPIAYAQPAPRPEWMFCLNKLDAGHRGAGSGRRNDLPEDLLENTIDSFNYAHRHGADMCELDVMCTADGVPVVYHNYMLDTKQPMQIAELTLDELRCLRNCSINDENCKHSDSQDNHRDQDASKTKLAASYSNGSDNKPFPTLEEVLRNVDQSCALNIELKWAQMLPNGKNEATHYREINDFVDRILDCIYEFSNDRAIMLSTLSADIAIMLRLKQSRYPVLFLTTGDSQRFNDPATKSVKNAIHLAQAFDMAGINPNAKWLNEFLVRYAKDRGLLIYAWGEIETPQTIKELRQYGLDGVIYDRIDLIKPQD